MTIGDVIMTLDFRRLDIVQPRLQRVSRQPTDEVYTLYTTVALSCTRVYCTIFFVIICAISIIIVGTDPVGAQSSPA
jgi:hypothetical protein